MAYSASTDLLNGNIPIPQYLDKEKFVTDAADEIDSKIGFLYQTPIDVATNSAVSRPARLLLKRINNHLATGRLLLAADAGGENDQVHAYGLFLIQEANAALDAIAAGEPVIEGAVKIDNGAGTVVSSVIVENLDPESHVEAFYDRVMNPAYSFGYQRYGALESESLNP